MYLCMSKGNNIPLLNMIHDLKRPVFDIRSLATMRSVALFHSKFSPKYSNLQSHSIYNMVRSLFINVVDNSICFDWLLLVLNIYLMLLDSKYFLIFY